MPGLLNVVCVFSCQRLFILITKNCKKVWSWAEEKKKNVFINVFGFFFGARSWTRLTFAFGFLVCKIHLASAKDVLVFWTINEPGKSARKQKSESNVNCTKLLAFMNLRLISPFSSILSFLTFFFYCEFDLQLSQIKQFKMRVHQSHLKRKQFLRQYGMEVLIGWSFVCPEILLLYRG